MTVCFFASIVKKTVTDRKEQGDPDMNNYKRLVYFKYLYISL